MATTKFKTIFQKIHISLPKVKVTTNVKLLHSSEPLSLSKDKDKDKDTECDDTGDDAEPADDKSWIPKEVVTHTGQFWDENDYRLARFVDRPKHVNLHFPYETQKGRDIIEKKDRITYCDGGGPFGHPKVYINLDKPGPHYCFYCGEKFTLKHKEEEY